MNHPVDIIRVYEDPGRQGTEYRVLVDRLWPRGRTRESVDYDEWLKDVAPGTQLRQWFGHNPERFPEFASRYQAELSLPPGILSVQRLSELHRARPVVLLTATRDIEHSGAIVLRSAITHTNPLADPDARHGLR